MAFTVTSAMTLATPPASPAKPATSGAGPAPWQKMLWRRGGAALAASGALLTGCGGGDSGPAVEARAQSIQFGPAPALMAGSTASVSATASSGLPVSYDSSTPGVCTVHSSSGVVTGLGKGTCALTANQPGDTRFAPAPPASQRLEVGSNPRQTLSFAPAPALSLGGSATAVATASSGLPVRYSTLTPGICSVNARTGLVAALTLGTCTLAADQDGDLSHEAAAQATQNLTVYLAPGVTAPPAPGGVTATLGNPAIAGDLSGVVTVSIGASDSGGSPITGYTVTSIPAGLSASGRASPIAVPCAYPCNGYRFTVTARNSSGPGAPSAPVDVLTAFQVKATFFEPDTQPRDSIFIGDFVLNSTTGSVSGLKGRLSESMTGDQLAYPNDNMTWLALNHQLSAVADGAGGWLVTTFLLNTTATFVSDKSLGGTDGWAPGSGYALYAGFPKQPNPSSGGIGNAYARILVNPQNPTAPLTPAQIDKLAYADCAAGGMMGATCMTGTTLAGYGVIGSMSGYPVSQVISKKP